ncbi:GNAT family N-acetyltransferase [Aquimarina sp. MAR_2010_214]|uniref:GNAT family N-acetyltransferase n=1 Tax=Aquimarina sp. MAR_2010_214 TaxID=1250026 RepID=UPI001178368F|nr:GNAT family N-acetyltransferase [Aquimarina sp. MAR_2010_214]
MLRKITLDDKEEMFQLHSNSDVQKYTGEPLVESIEEVEQAYRQELTTMRSMDMEDGLPF